MAREFQLLVVLWLVAVCLSETPATSAPGASTTTKGTTITPEASTATKGSTLAPKTPATTPGASTTTKGQTLKPGTATTIQGSTVTPGTTTTPTPTTTELPDPCKSEPCLDGSTCERRAGLTFVCLCLPGDSYNNVSKSCEKAKVFPGQLSVPELTYKKEMSDKKSPVFQETSEEIVAELGAVFGKFTSYLKSIVLKLQPIQQSEVLSREERVVNAVVEIIFAANADITTEDITDEIKNYTITCEVCQLGNATFNEGTLCNGKEDCDSTTTKCTNKDGSYNCLCKENYVKTNFSTIMCIACPSGQKAEGPEKCVDCPFGYSGFNCDESWQLILVIVGSVLGGLLLITLILLPVVARKSLKKKNTNADIGKLSVSHSPDKAPLVNSSLANSQANGSANAFANAGVPWIPRATTTSSGDSKTNLEMTLSNSRQNLAPVERNSRLYEDPDDNQYAQVLPQNNPYGQNRAQINPYGQNRAQINPYGQNRAQTNPYASSQGQTNPYYVHDDGRRFN